MGSWARDKLRDFRDRLANGMGFGGPRPEVPVARWHWEGQDYESRRRTPNEVCSREFTLELVSPIQLEMGKSGALSIRTKPKVSAAVKGITGELRIENQNPDILTYDEETATVTGLKEGVATLNLQWWQIGH